MTTWTANTKRSKSWGLLLLSGALACSSPNPGMQNAPSGGSAGAGGMATGGVGGGSGLDPAPSWVDLPAVQNPDKELGNLPSREKQYDKLCALQHDDTFFHRVCGGVRPNIPDLAGLLHVANLDQTRAFALTGNSTSLVSKNVSALNPRILVFPRVDPDLDAVNDYTIVGFVRGERFAEVASRDQTTGEPNFYLLTFEQHCDYDGSCDLASALTEEIEHDWTAYSIYAEPDLENTSFDCLTCHRPQGFGKSKILRMQELSSPWMHWFPQRFVQRTDSDRVLSAEFGEIHGQDKQYGGVPLATIQNALDDGSGAQLEALIRAQGFADQPNVFDPRIEAEAKDGAQSATWLAQWMIATQGGAITVPYPQVDVTDPSKRMAATQSYKDVVSGAAARATLLDIRDVFSDDATQKLSFVPQTGADGRAVLVQMCSRCHDGRADPALGRSRFNVMAFDQMSASELALARERVQEPTGSVLKMPPWRAGELTPEALQAVLAALPQP